jgi:splicing factor 3B subunit 3
MLSGRGHEGALRILRHGLSVSEMAATELPGKPSAIWSVRKTRSDDFDQYIVVSFVASTLVLSVGETVEDVPEHVCGFSLQNPTLDVQQIGDDGLVQVCVSVVLCERESVYERERECVCE